MNVVAICALLAVLVVSNVLLWLVVRELNHRNEAERERFWDIMLSTVSRMDNMQKDLDFFVELVLDIQESCDGKQSEE